MINDCSVLHEHIVLPFSRLEINSVKLELLEQIFVPLQG